MLKAIRDARAPVYLGARPDAAIQDATTWHGRFVTGRGRASEKNGLAAYAAHKETAAIANVFPRYFYYHAASWIGQWSDPALR